MYVCEEGMGWDSCVWFLTGWHNFITGIDHQTGREQRSQQGFYAAVNQSWCEPGELTESEQVCSDQENWDQLSERKLKSVVSKYKMIHFTIIFYDNR